MIDHSSNIVCSPARFRELVRNLDAVEADLDRLGRQRLLPEGVTGKLKRLFHARYQYIQQRHYIEESSLTLTADESAAITAHWVIELELAVLRRADPNSAEGRDSMKSVERAISYELSFLEEYEQFKSEVERRRRVLIEDQASGKDVDFRPFENERARRTLLLVEAYRDKRIPIGRSVKAVMPYLVSLTVQPMTGGPPGSSVPEQPSL